ncbi:splicing factor, suppressor of white-apricot homolog isoform X2 [Mercenaria mercenaria]|uniref:splicing factor, suppressor of white-apricot homolog isoform X2 n=1 Tax=Mercenaria mercenaria TaxID=6596 RepID=UPI00234F0346|nr:splicing factor, suppressor of white-apricot homolog isoform X2 [Mercenaria mercenaria]
MASEWLFPTDEQNEDSSDKTRSEELFVFGYHCKLFRDDEQAKMVDSGTYMIPWMGDEKLKIDRYDGRGHLYDLRPYDADSLKGLPAPVLTEDELHIEKLCDEERYLELHTDLAEKTMYEEEEWKRYYESLSEGYKAVGFSYDAYGQPQAYTEPVPEESKPNPEEAVFVPAKELQVPAGVAIPSTVKENAIIEKTAKFIAEHGVQMEIVMKTKQSNNPQFQFMHFENILHPYYKHLVKMIKTKKYIPKSPAKEERDAHNDSGEGDDGGHGYLHPTLMTTNRASPVPQEVYKPIQMPKVSIHETSYGQLLQSFSKVNKEVEDKKREREDRMKKEVKSEPKESSSLPACVAQPVYGSSMPPPPGIEPVQLPKASGDQKNSVQIKEEPDNHSDSASQRTSSPPPQIVPPPPDVQPIIDRMAMYVAKNGEEFSIVVKSKKDQRFQFLETWHTHYPYYDFKRHLFQEEIEKERKMKEAEERKKEQEKAEILAKGVKFKLKKANKEQDSTTIEKKPVFEYDESDDAEQRLKDRLAASAREKLSQVDKEKQIKAERKKKAAMFINLLKSQSDTAVEEDKKILPAQATPASSGRNTPVKVEDEKSTHHKSKHKSRSKRSRSRSRDRSSRSRRSRSRSRSKKKKRKRSPTPPSAYNVTRRSPLRFPPPPPPPPRYMDIRSRYSRSPSKGGSSRRRSRSKDRSSRQRSHSRSPSRSKSKKKKRSRSPKSKKDHSSHRKSSKKKKKRSRSRSREKKVIGPAENPIPEETEVEVIVPDQIDPRVSSPAGLEEDSMEALEEGETRDSTPEPGQISDTDTTCKESPPQSPPRPPDIDPEATPRPSEHSPCKRKRSRSVSSSSSRSTTPPSKLRSRSRSLSPETRSRSRSLTRSKSRSRSRSSSRSEPSPVKCHMTPLSNSSISREATPVPGETSAVSGENIASSGETTASVGEVNGEAEMEPTQSQKNVSSYMLNRVRAIIKASREAVRKEDDMFVEDT